jgi:hypothetical protein
MELLQEVANISGRQGLFRILKPGRGGVIVESLDSVQKREMISANAKVSVLKEISIYSTGTEQSKPLSEIFLAIKENFKAEDLLETKTASNSELFDFMEKAMPDFDKERVYVSDIKKIINWYKILVEFFPEVFEKKEEETEK